MSLYQTFLVKGFISSTIDRPKIRFLRCNSINPTKHVQQDFSSVHTIRFSFTEFSEEHAAPPVHHLIRGKLHLGTAANSHQELGKQVDFYLQLILEKDLTANPAAGVDCFFYNRFTSDPGIHFLDRLAPRIHEDTLEVRPHKIAEMSSLMKAGQWDRKHKKVIINAIPIPEPGPNQILVKIISASLCHSDLKAFEIPGEEAQTLGHEGAGLVAKLHESAEGKGFQVGDAIGFLYHIGSCHECEGCQLHSAFCFTGCKVQGITAPGFFAQYAVVDLQNAIHIPPTWDLKSSSVFFCAGLTAFHSVNSCQLEPGQWLGVVGAGGVGQLAIQYAMAMGFNVVAVDINDQALETASAVGASETFNSRTCSDYVSKLRTVTAGGVHAAAVFTGARAAYKNAFQIIRLGGLLMAVGIMNEPLEVNTLEFAMGKYRIKSENVGMPRQMKKAMDFTTKHKIAPEVQFRKLEDLGSMVAEMREGAATKRMVVNPWA